MNKKVRNIFIIVLITFLVIFLIGLILIYYPAFPHNKNKAREIAVEYVDEKFEQQMSCLGVNVSIWETVMYSVYFSPKNDPDLIFEVMLSQDFELPDHPDNYILKYYEKEMKQRLEPVVASIWPEASILLVDDQPLLGFRIDDGLDENSTFEDIQEKVSYALWVNMNTDMKTSEVQTEAARIYELIKKIQEEEYTFEEISFFYNDERIEFSNWKEIKGISEVEEKLDVAEPTEAPDAVIFQSRTIEKNVREQIYDGMEDVPMVKEDLKQCSNLYIKVDKDDEHIKNLEDLQYFPEIKTISIMIDEEATEQKILDYSYLQDLPGIEELNVQDPFFDITLLQVIPEVNITNVEKEREESWKTEVDKALAAYDPTETEMYGERGKILHCYMGDANGDGTDDVGLVVGWEQKNASNFTESGSSVWIKIYIYLKQDNTYTVQNPIDIGNEDDLYERLNPTMWDEGYYMITDCGICLCQGKVIMQQSAFLDGIGKKVVITDIYTYDQDNQWNLAWTKEMNTHATWDAKAEIKDYEHDRYQEYVWVRNEVPNIRLKTKDNALSEKNGQSSYDFCYPTLDYLNYKPKENLMKMPCSAQEALDTVMAEYSSQYIFTKVYYDEECRDNNSILLGVEVPDYYYWGTSEKGNIYIAFGNPKDDGYWIKVSDDDSCYEKFWVDANTGSLENKE